jgi:hypothetical protein
VTARTLRPPATAADIGRLERSLGFALRDEYVDQHRCHAQQIRRTDSGRLNRVEVVNHTK